MYLLGYDIGSSSIKAALVEAESRSTIKRVQSPAKEMDIIAHQAGWAEQEPELWWQNLCQATRMLLQSTDVNPHDIKGIGISYQMHGLVIVDKDQKVLRPSIIWCDSRAVEIGEQAFNSIGTEKCLSHLLNSPGNFTASKLKWVKDNEPDLYHKAYKFMLPGDYIAMRLTGEISTTVSGLSEGMLWDFEENAVAELLLDHYEINRDLVPDIVSTFSNQGALQDEIAGLLGLKAGIPVGYRGGDQPNNAMSLNVLKPGEIAATGGTSGVVFGVVDRPVFDKNVRVNGFAHVNHQPEKPSVGVLLCINGAGIQYGWMKQNLAGSSLSYQEMEQLAGKIPVGSEGLRILPFGNGTERMLGNRNLGSHILGLQLTKHTASHMYRAALEGIAFSFAYGMDILKEMGLLVQVMKVGNDNLFQSKVFSSTLATLAGCEINVMETNGAVGAAKASGIAAGFYKDIEEAIGTPRSVETFTADEKGEAFFQGYEIWKADLDRMMKE
ncbi:MAG: carbohydrate kinase [Cyclobacteriaceae bacterium]|nr:MAG: carbohydrate kinase [Cyclobacteriaceae bacterium]